jgi:hypothetical protein
MKNGFLICLVLSSFFIFACAKPKAHVSGLIRSDGVINSRQMLVAGGGNVATSWPLQPFPGTYNGSYMPDLLVRPNASFGIPTPSINVALTDLTIGKTFFDAYMNLNFIGFDFGDGAGLLTNAFIQVTEGNHSVAAGRLAHPLIITYCVPSVVTVDLGSPITPFALAAQVRYRYGKDSVYFTGALFNQYLVSNSGPLPPDYLYNIYMRNATMPSVFGSLEYQDDYFLFGIGLTFQRLRPRLFTYQTDFSPSVVATGEHILTAAGTLYASYRNKDVYITAQSIYGQNGTAWSNFGGYGVSTVNPINNLKTYIPIYFQSSWCDISLLLGDWWIQPGCYVGITSNLGTKQRLDLTEFVYTLDDYQLWVYELYDVSPQFVMRLIRFSPRVWLYVTPQIAVGLEATLFRITYANANEYFNAIDPTTTRSLQGLVSFQYLF